MNADPFEERLRAQPLRPLPGDWRASILQEACAALPSEVATDAAPPAKGDRATHVPSEDGASVWKRWRLFVGWVRPWPLAWSSLAACWLAILVLDAAARPDANDIRQAQLGARSAAAYFSLLQRSWQVDAGERVPAPPLPRPDSQGCVYLRRNDCYA